MINYKERRWQSGSRLAPARCLELPAPAIEDGSCVELGFFLISINNCSGFSSSAPLFSVGVWLIICWAILASYHKLHRAGVCSTQHCRLFPGTLQHPRLIYDTLGPYSLYSASQSVLSGVISSPGTHYTHPAEIT